MDEFEAWLRSALEGEPILASSLADIRAKRALARRDFKEAAHGLLENGRLDPFNAVWSFSEAAVQALIARDAVVCREALDALGATASHAAMAKVGIRVAEAGLHALEGRIDAARNELLAAFAAFGDVGARRRQALTGLIMATLLDDAEQAVRTAIDESRRAFEAMGAGLGLSLMDEALAGRSAAAATPNRG
jgi:hypothetical protein